MTEPTLLFGLGAAKCGTSWLHECLLRHPQCHFRAVKEVHYFDAIDFDRRAQQVDLLTAQHARLTRELTEDLGQLSLDRVARKSARAVDIGEVRALIEAPEDMAAYLAYLDEGRGGARVIGDITPAYSLLSEARLRRMAHITTNVRFVYILRDPVARLWSHVRMIASRRAQALAEIPARASRILSRTIKGLEGEITARSDYAGALDRLIAAIRPPQRLVMFYEDLTAPGGLDTLARFLGIDAFSTVPARAHVGPKLDMPAEQRRAARDWLVPQYNHVAATVGTLPDAWRTEMSKV
ncbi:MAG: sulfotransferase [Rhodobacteraceae bacterium]|nr:sulfotransferase [Paracoccaceae bacterium]